MKAIKNFIIGLLVSFAGSLPLGYLNIIGYEIYTASGHRALMLYVTGVIIVEAIVIYATLAFAEKLAAQKHISKLIDVFTICFLIFLAVAFYIQPELDGGHYSRTLPTYSYLVAGIALSALNFIQIPFWAGWNLYLVNSSLISPVGKLRFVYIAGTLAGTFLGMMLLVMGLANLTTDGMMPRLLVAKLIPLIFLLLALYNSFTFYRKYYAPKR